MMFMGEFGGVFGDGPVCGDDGLCKQCDTCKSRQESDDMIIYVKESIGQLSIDLQFVQSHEFVDDKRKQMIEEIVISMGGIGRDIGEIESFLNE